MGWGSGVAVSCGVGRRLGSDPLLLWLWRRLAATAPIGPLAWGPPCAVGVALKKHKNKQKNITKWSVFLLSPVFGHRFVILDSDDYVLKYMESNPAQFSPEALLSIQNHIRRRDTPALELDRYVWPSEVCFGCGTVTYSGNRRLGHHILDSQISFSKWESLDIHRLPGSSVITSNLGPFQLQLFSKYLSDA